MNKIGRNDPCGKIPYDFGWLWKELGLEKERGK